MEIPLYSEGDEKRFAKIKRNRSTPEEPYRTEFRRDYARVIHCGAFRRLQGKTQLFPSIESDFFRTRMTHSLEVAQVATAIAMKINAENDYFRRHPISLDVVEVAGLCHDLGHPPFGHNGEAALDQCMIDAGGFEGNAQTLRIISKLEKRQTKQNDGMVFSNRGKDQRVGLNLTMRSLASVIKYDRAIPIGRERSDKLVKGYYESEREIVRHIKENTLGRNTHDGEFKSIECQIMDVADDIAYSTYDLEDTFKAGFLTPLQILAAPASLFERVAESVTGALKYNVEAKKVVEHFINQVFPDVFKVGPTEVELITSGSAIQAAQFLVDKYNLSELMAKDGYSRTEFTSDLIGSFISGVQVDLDANEPILSKVYLDDETLQTVEILKRFTFEATIKSPRLKVVENRGYEIVSEIFTALSEPGGKLLLPDDFQALYDITADRNKRRRVICDFIAGMTDRYAVEFYGRLKSESAQSIFEPL